MLDRIEKLARLSVSRACGFAALAIVTFFIGLSSDLALALKMSGILSLLTCSILLLKARWALQRPYKHTEVWLLLKPEDRPQAAIAQQIIGTVMRETFLYFAFHAGVAAAGCLFLSMIAAAMFGRPGI